MGRPQYEQLIDKDREEKKIKINLLTPSRVIWTEQAWEALLPGLTGGVGVLWNHATLVTALDTGLCRILHEIEVEKNKTNTSGDNTETKTEEKKEVEKQIVWTPIVVCGGLAEIDRNRVTILASDVEEVFQVDEKETIKRLEKAILEVEEIGIIDEENQDHMDKVAEVKKARAVLQADQYLSDGEDKKQATVL